MVSIHILWNFTSSFLVIALLSLYKLFTNIKFKDEKYQAVRQKAKLGHNPFNQ